MHCEQVPRVADFSLTRVAIERVGVIGKQYKLEMHSGDVVPASHVFVKDPPTEVRAPNTIKLCNESTITCLCHQGVANSPMEALKSPLLFVQKLTEYALQCESVRSRQLITTQVTDRASKHDPNLDPRNLFFDHESRAISSAQEDQSDAQHFQNLQLSARLAAELNKVQQTRPGAVDAAQTPAQRLNISEPPPVPPAMFVAPSGQARCATPAHPLRAQPLCVGRK